MAAVQPVLQSSSIERRHLPSYQLFVRDYLHPHRPLIITGALEQWKAKEWTPEFFKETFSGKIVQIDGKKYTMAELIDLVVKSSEAHPAPYLRNAILKDFAPQLHADITPLPHYFSPNWIAGPMSQLLKDRLHEGSAELYIGGRGGKFPYLHFDACHTHAFLCQLYGTKEFTCYSADQTPHVYPRPDRYNVSQIPDIENADHGKFPLFAKATAMRFKLEPGEILFVPGGLWHTARILTPSITVSVNRANASNWSSVTRDVCADTRAYLRPLMSTYMAALKIFRTLYGS
jgi:hypothetical protein